MIDVPNVPGRGPERDLSATARAGRASHRGKGEVNPTERSSGSTATCSCALRFNRHGHVIRKFESESPTEQTNGALQL
jgi:hypothetical protein